MTLVVLFIAQGLTQVEEMLISAVLPIMSLYKLPHGQYFLILQYYTHRTDIAHAQ